MKKLLMSLCLVFIMLGCSLLTPQYTRTPEQLSSINNSVVALSIIGKEGPVVFCSGSFVSDTTVLTAAHCVSHVSDDDVQSVITYKDYTDSNYHIDNNTNSTKFIVSARDESKDLALLSAVESVPAHNYFKVAKKAPKQGENVVLMGHPYRIPWSLSHGVVSSAKRTSWPGEPTKEDPLFIQHDAVGAPGSSGGPLLSYNNKIIGVLSQGWRGEGYIAMSVHTTLVRSFCKENNL